jgi:hypothetical protein
MTIDFKTSKFPMETVKKTGVASKEAIDAWHDLIEEGCNTPPLEGETRIRRTLASFMGDYSAWSPNTRIVKSLVAMMRVWFQPKDLGVGLVQGPHELTHIRVEGSMLVRFVIDEKRNLYIDVHRTGKGNLHITASWGRMLVLPCAANTIEVGREEYH